jgi:3-mercaptopyruvate sulfurtransferase SseA
VSAGDPVVCYDQASGAFAARLWWMLRWVGHDTVAVLDGGLAKWAKENRPMTAEVPHFPATKYPANLRAGMSVDVSHVESHLGKDLLLDARSRNATAAKSSRSIRLRATSLERSIATTATTSPLASSSHQRN